MGKSKTVSSDLSHASQSLNDNADGDGGNNSRNALKSKSSSSLRQKLMYSNCFMQAPDGQVLCVCDAKKAQWYCEKELAG
jgi:hypothetical protein